MCVAKVFIDKLERFWKPFFMVVRLRLARHGQRNRPFYRIVAADARAPRDGRFIEIVGFYNPLAHSRQEV